MTGGCRECQNLEYDLFLVFLDVARKSILLGWLSSYLKKRHLLRSYEHPVVVGAGRDALRYYEGGRSVYVYAELLMGEYDRLLSKNCILKWDDNGVNLTPEERERVFKVVCDYLNKKKIKWKFAIPLTPEEKKNEPQRIRDLMNKSGAKWRMGGHIDKRDIT